MNDSSTAGAGFSPNIPADTPAWSAAKSAPLNRVVMTKIDDGEGVRNEQALMRSGNLWFVPDGSMYVYYRPTHWRELTDAEREAELVKVHQHFKADLETFNRACASLAKPGA